MNRVVYNTTCVESNGVRQCTIYIPDHNVSAEQLFLFEMKSIQFTFSCKNDVTPENSDVNVFQNTHTKRVLIMWYGSKLHYHSTFSPIFFWKYGKKVLQINGRKSSYVTLVNPINKAYCNDINIYNPFTITYNVHDNSYYDNMINVIKCGVILFYL